MCSRIRAYVRVCARARTSLRMSETRWSQLKSLDIILQWMELCLHAIVTSVPGIDRLLCMSSHDRIKSRLELIFLVGFVFIAACLAAGL